MTGVLNVDTIADNAGTGPVTLTKQSAAKTLFAMNLAGATNFGVANNAVSTQTLNVSSGTDAGTASPRANLTNSMNALDYIWCEGIVAGNNTANLVSGTSTTSLLAYIQKDADSNGNIDDYSSSAVFGDLA